jgi:hypothetical protein
VLQDIRRNKRSPQDLLVGLDKTSTGAPLITLPLGGSRRFSAAPLPGIRFDRCLHLSTNSAGTTLPGSSVEGVQLLGNIFAVGVPSLFRAPFCHGIMYPHSSDRRAGRSEEEKAHVPFRAAHFEDVQSHPVSARIASIVRIP